MTKTTCWLASYPKSGNTWMRMVWEATAAKSDVDINSLEAPGLIAANRQGLDSALGLESSVLTADEVALLRPRADDMVESSQRGPTLRKVHDALMLGPAGEPIVSVGSALGAIYMLRDPRDVAVSFAHHMAVDVENAVEMMVGGVALKSGSRYAGIMFDQHLLRWDDHVTSWVDSTLLDCHIVRYEDCLASPLATFGAALRFAGLEVSGEDLEGALEKTSFARLAAQEDAEGFREATRSGARFFRSGRPGQWVEALSPSLVKTLQEEFGPVMRRFGYLP